MFGKNDSVKRRIFYAVVSVLHIISDTRGQTPVLTITANTVKIGSNFTVTCNVITNSVIQFFLNDNEEGYCPPPFLGQPCNPTDIKQDTTAAETSWTLPAETGYEGSWKCSRSSVNSTSVAVNMYNCPNTIISESGITTNVTLNDTATVTIKVKISCIYPAINPEISLQFMSSDSPSIPSTIMSCRQTTGTCSAGSAFECTQLISFDGTTLSSGSPTFEKEKSYSLNINVEPSTGTCDLLAIFESYRLIFETTGSLSPQSSSGLPCWVWLLITAFVVICIIIYVIYRCSNKNCKTHVKCWKCSWVCYSDYPLLTKKSSEEWNVEHYCCSNPCCPFEGCNKKCCSCFLCCGCCLTEFPAKRVKGNGQPITRPLQSPFIDEKENNTKRKKKKKKAKDMVKKNNDEPNSPVEKYTKEEKAVHTTTINNTKRQPNSQGERRLSLDSLNSKSNKIYPSEEKQVHNTKILDPIMLNSGNIEINHSSTPRPLPVLPPIEKKTS